MPGGLLDVSPLDEAETKAMLAQGIIPENLRDDWKLVDENTDIARKFQSTMERITQKLLDDAGEELDVRSLGIRFMLCHDDNPNAAIVTDAVPPIMMFTSGMLKRLQTLDQLEAVIGHELGHKVFKDKLGQHRNSKGEEVGADFYGIYLLFKAKRNVEAGKELVQMLMRETSDFERWVGYVDPHPNDHMRVRILENTYEGIKEQYGGYTTASTPMDAEIEQFKEFAHKTIFEQELEIIGYDKFPLEKKVEWLARQIPLAQEWYVAGYGSRADEFKKLLRYTAMDCRMESYKYTSAKDRDKCFDLVQKLVEVTARSKSNDFYNAVTIMGEYEPFTLLRCAVEDFIASKSPEATAKAAAEIMQVLNDRPYPEGKDVIIRAMQLDGFKYPKKQDIEAAEKSIMEEFMKAAPLRHDHDKLYAELCETYGVETPWSAQVKHCLQTGSEEIAHVARLLGVADPRLPKLPENPNPKTRKQGWSTEEDRLHPTIARAGFEHDDANVWNLKLSESGKWVSLAFDNKEMAYTESDPAKAILYEEFRMVQENMLQKLATEKTDFTGMEHDFWAFVANNKEYLKPTATLKGVESKEYFAEKFTATLRGLIDKDPAKFMPMAYEFFAGRSFDASRTPILQGNPEGKFTLPIILEQNLTNTLSQYTRSGIPMGVNMQHPYFRFMRNDRDMIFSNEDRIVPWQYASFLKKKYEPGNRPADILEPEIFALHKDTPTSFAGALQASKDFLIPAIEAAAREEEYYSPSFTNESHGRKYLCASEYVILQASLNEAVLQRTEPYGLTELSELEAFYKNFGREAFGNAKEFRANILKTNRVLDFSGDISADELMRKYDYYTNQEYFEGKPKLRREYQAKLLERKAEFTASPEMKLLCQSMLQHHAFTSPEFDKLLTNHWNNCQTEKIIDASALTAELVTNKIPITRINEMMAQLAEKHTLQPAACYEIERQLNDAGLSELPQSHLKAVTAEIIIDLVGENAEVRQQMLEYLSTSATPETTQKTVDVINEATKKSLHKWKSKVDGNLSEEQKADILTLMHENYCSWPINWQAVYLEKILFPVNNQLAKRAGLHVTIESETALVLDKMFPPDKPNAKEARDFIECYLEQHTEAGQRLVLAMVMAANREGEFDSLENLSPMRQSGRAVGRILSKQHPLGVKFAQEIESYAGTNPEFRLGLQDIDVKAGVDLGTRWQTMHLLEDATKGHPELFEDVEIGEVLGGGAVQVNVRVNDWAVALLRNNVNERAARQYAMFGGTIDGFLKRNPGFAGISEILESSYKNLAIETDYSLAPIQAANVQMIYNDGVIEADGRDVHFAAVEFHGSDSKFKVYSLAKGVHFNDLPVATPEQRSIKKAAAKAIITRELTAMMRGQAIDSDRHGKQQKIQVRPDGSLLITNFDDGAVAINPPSTEEKQILGKVIGKCVEQMLYENRPISETIMEVTKEYAGTAHGNYVETSKRALRTMFGDYMNAAYTETDGTRKTLLEAADVKEIASAVLRAGKLDKNIIYPAAREIGYKALTQMHKGSVSKTVLDIINAAGSFVQRMIKGRKEKPAITVKDPGHYLDKILAAKLQQKQPDWKERLADKATDVAGQAAGGLIK